MSARLAPHSTAPQEHGILELIRSDYEAHADIAGDSPRVAALKLPLRFLTNTSLRANVLVRLACGCPRSLHWLFRSLLVLLHSSDVVYGARIGPRLHMPHPVGIVIGGHVVIGTGVTIGQNVTLGANLAGTGQPRVGDGAMLLAGAVLAGPISIGERATIGANVVVGSDVPADAICGAPRPQVIKRAAVEVVRP